MNATGRFNIFAAGVLVGEATFGSPLVWQWRLLGASVAILNLVVARDLRMRREAKLVACRRQNDELLGALRRRKNKHRITKRSAETMHQRLMQLESEFGNISKDAP